MAYLPKSKYQQKYTNGDEFIVVSTGRPYVGDYLELSNKTYFAGKTPQTITVELKPIIESSATVVSNVANRKFEILNPSYVRKQRKYVTPVATKVFPTKTEYDTGSFTRYFLFRLLKDDYIEVDKKTYEESQAGDIIDKSLYIGGQIPWSLKGDVENNNLNTLLITEQFFPKINLLFPNLVEFIAPNQTQFLTNPSTVADILAASDTDNQEENSGEENLNEDIDVEDGSEDVDEGSDEDSGDSSGGSPSDGSGDGDVFTNIEGFNSKKTKSTPGTPSNPFNRRRGY